MSARTPDAFVKIGALDIEACENEPIQFIGALQSPYILILFDPDTLRVLAATENIVELVSRDLAEVIGSRVCELLPISSETIAEIMERFGDTVPIDLNENRKCHVRPCRASDYVGLLIDPDPVTTDDLSGFNATVRLNNLIEQSLGDAEFEIGTILSDVALTFREVSKFDRVMVYQFDDDWNGHVIAEAANPNLDSRFLGLTFPSSDIPRQARDLFLQNRVRPLVDTTAVPVKIVAQGQLDPKTIDIGSLPERAVSPIHLQYLNNMGVTATLNIALIVQEKLWGLLSCHHYGGRHKLSPTGLHTCRVICDLLSHGLNRIADRTRMRMLQQIEHTARELRAIAQESPDPLSMDDIAQQRANEMLALLKADGVILKLAHGTHLIGTGEVDSASILYAEVKSIIVQRDEEGLITHSLSHYLPQLKRQLLPEFAGVAAAVDAQRGIGLMAWRKAVPRMESWAGDPEKRVANTGALSPRASFEIWQAETAEKSLPWEPETGTMMQEVLSTFSELEGISVHRSAQRKAHVAQMEAERARNELEYAALHDALTSLPNRRYLDQYLKSGFAAKQGKSSAFAVLHIDLDRFKQVNDTLGHAYGDAVLIHTANTLRSEAVATDFVSRVGGDEFVLIASDLIDQDGLAARAQRLIHALSKPIVIGEHVIHCGASIGIAVNDTVGLDHSTLLVRADIALYEAKRKGRGRHCFFTPQLEWLRIEQRRLSDDVIRGVQANEFVVYYQPKFDAQTRQMIGAEALIRWQHPKRGLLLPNEFLAAADDVGLMDAIDGMVVETAMAASRALSSQLGRNFKVSVNISARFLSTLNIDVLTQSYPELSKYISMELVENILLDTINVNLQDLAKIRQLRRLGVEIDIDDFGTGYTSILGLVKVQPDRIKIDKDLVIPILDSQLSQDLIRSVVGIANSMGIPVVAEGVEEEAHATLATLLGCKTLQGFGLARPMPLQDLMALAA